MQIFIEIKLIKKDFNAKKYKESEFEKLQFYVTPLVPNLAIAF